VFCSCEPGSPLEEGDSKQGCGATLELRLPPTPGTNSSYSNTVRIQKSWLMDSQDSSPKVTKDS
jgi:hypothetical protein